MAQQGFSDEDLFRAAQAADAAGDTEAARKLTQALIAGKTQDQIETLAANLGQTIDKKALAANIQSRDAGGQTNQFVQTTPTVTSQLGDATIATVKGVGKAIAGPYDLLNEAAGGVQQGINYLLTEAVAMPADALGANEFAQSWRDTGQQVRDRQGAATDRLSVRNALDGLVATPQGQETTEFASELVSGLAIPLGPKGRAPIRAPQPVQPANAAQEIIAEGARRGVPVKTTDVLPPKSGMGRYIKQTLPEKIPFAGTSGPRQAQQEARQRAVVEIVEEFGGNTGREVFDVAGNGVADISKALTAERSKRLTTLTNAKRGVIEGIREPFSNAPNTVRAISEQVRALREIDEVEFAPVIERLQRFGDQLTSGKSLATVEEQRKLLGGLFDDPGLAGIKDRGQKAINAIYDPLRRDMGDFIEAQAGPGARTRWSKANEQLSAMAGELTSARFRNVLRDAETTPEAVGRILFSSPDNVSDARRLVANLDPAGRKKVQGALLQRAFDAAGGADGVSVERFLGNLKRLSGQIGVAFEGQDRAALEGMRKLLEATRRGAESGANIRTGEQNLPAVMGVAATQALGMTGGVATLGVGGLLARLYESPLVRDQLVKLSKTKSGSQQEQRVLALVMRSAAPTVNRWQDNIARAVNDNPSGALAAEEQQNEPN